MFIHILESNKETFFIENFNLRIKKISYSRWNIISGTGTLDGKTSSGWKDVLGKISEAHPRSDLAKQYGKRSTKDIKVQSTLEKHKKIRQQRTQGR